MTYINPKFKINSNGIVFCINHSNYKYIKDLANNEYNQRLLEKELTCKTCLHYFQDQCYFTKASIDRIEHDRTFRRVFKCKFCENKIDRMLTVIQKLYYKEQYNVELPLICCSCFKMLDEDKFIDHSINRSDTLTMGIIGSIIWILIYLLFYLTLRSVSFSLFIGLSIIPFYGILYRVWRKNKINKGIEIYRKNFADLDNDIEDNSS